MGELRTIDREYIDRKIEEYNESGGEFIPDFRGTSLVPLQDYSEMDVSLCELDGIKWQSHQLDRLTIQSTSLTRATFFDCIARRSDFRQSNLTEVDLTMSDFQSSDFQLAVGNRMRAVNTHLEFARMRMIVCQDADFSGAYLWHTLFNGVPMMKCKFVCAHMDHTSMIGTLLPGCDFTGAELFSVNLTFANLTDANFAEASLTDTNFDRAILTGTLFESKEQLLAADLQRIKEQFMIVFYHSSVESVMRYRQKLLGRIPVDFFKQFKVASVMREEEIRHEKLLSRHQLIERFLTGQELCDTVGFVPVVREVIIGWCEQRIPKQFQ